MRLQFVLGKGLGSSAIAWFSGGSGATRLSHVDAVLPDGRLLGARSDHVGGHPPGVWIRPAHYEKWRTVVQVEIPTGVKTSARWLDCLKQQVGKPYDHMAILGFALGRAWREDDSWICSELQAYAMENVGISPKLFLAASRITPDALALVCSALPGGKIVVLKSGQASR